MANREDPRLVHITELCSVLPEVVRAVHGDHADFRVRKRVFAYFLNNHHGDGIVSVCVRSALGENVDRAGAQPQLYYLPAYIGRRGWFGMRLDRVELSYCLAAPKTLAKIIQQRGVHAGARGARLAADG